MNYIRQRSYMTGMNGNYTTDTVTGTSILAPTQGSNYKSAYEKKNVLRSNPDYTNTNNILHNNVNNRIMREQIFTNKIFINSMFRDYTVHTEPFSFTVKLNGRDAVKENVEIKIGNKTYSYPKYMSGDTYVVLPHVFKNIKTVSVDALIIPSNIEYKTEEDGSYTITETQIAKRYKYVILKIKELHNYRNYTNNKNIGQESFIMTLDRTSGLNNQLWIPISNNVSYFDSRLRNLDRLTVNICDDRGNLLCTKLDGVKHDFYAEYRKIINDVIEIRSHYEIKEAENMIQCLIPRLDSLLDIIDCINPELHLSITTYEPQIDTIPNFNI